MDGFDGMTVDGGAHSAEDDLDFQALSRGVKITGTGNGAGTATDGASTLTFRGIEDIDGTHHDDRIDMSADAAGIEIEGNGGHDTVIGGAGDDEIEGNDGDDLLLGGDGDDRLDGGDGEDVLHGGEGDDELLGGDGIDRLHGGAGDDVIWTGRSGDFVDGGEGSDAIYLHSSSDGRNNVITDGGRSGVDTVHFESESGVTFEIQSDFSAAAGIEVIDGSAISGEVLGTGGAARFDFTGVTLVGVDAITGGEEDDEITGSAGDDVILGRGATTRCAAARGTTGWRGRWERPLRGRPGGRRSGGRRRRRLPG